MSIVSIMRPTKYSWRSDTKKASLNAGQLFQYSILALPEMMTCVADSLSGCETSPLCRQPGLSHANVLSKAAADPPWRRHDDALTIKLELCKPSQT